MELTRYRRWEDAFKRAKELLDQLSVVPYKGDQIQHYDLDRHAAGSADELLAYLAVWRTQAEESYGKLCEWVASTSTTGEPIEFDFSFLCGIWDDGALEVCLQQHFKNEDGEQIVNGVSEVCIHRLADGFVWYYPSEKLREDFGLDPVE